MTKKEITYVTRTGKAIISPSKCSFPRRDITNMAFGKLTAREFAGRRGRIAFWKCECECGNKIIVDSGHLISGHTKSCGCFKLLSKTKHGMHNTKIYFIWASMLDRIRNSNNYVYKNYGGRGISVCDRWMNFETFFADMGHAPSNKHSIDRIDNDGNYCPENCRWVTQDIQMQNRRNTKLNEYLVRGIRYFYETGIFSIGDLAKMCNVHYNAIWYMLKGKTWSNIS